MEWGRSSCVWCTSTSFVGVDDFRAVGCDLREEQLRAVEQPTVSARATFSRRGVGDHCERSGRCSRGVDDPLRTIGSLPWSCRRPSPNDRVVALGLLTALSERSGRCLGPVDDLSERSGCCPGGVGALAERAERCCSRSTHRGSRFRLAVRDECFGETGGLTVSRAPSWRA